MSTEPRPVFYIDDHNVGRIADVWRYLDARRCDEASQAHANTLKDVLDSLTRKEAP